MVDQHPQEDDFGAYLEAHLADLRTEFDVGDRVGGVVTAIDRNSVFLDVGARSDGILDRAEMLDADGQLTVALGDRVEAFYVGADDDQTVRLSTKMTGSVADASLSDAYASGMPIEGRVASERKGGFEVEVAHREAFCPYSQIDLFKKDSAVYLGQRFTFLITEFSEGGRNIVLSRRRILEQERARLREDLKGRLEPGLLVRGTVMKLMPFGAFVDLGGVEGLIHVSELGWGRNTKPEDILEEGQDVEVGILSVDWEQDRISLSLKQAKGDPWSDVELRYTVGKKYAGTVTKLMPFGAFVELEPGIEGLVHVSQLGTGGRVHHPEEVLTAGDHVEVSLLSVDVERRRLGLSMDDTLGTDVEQEGGDVESAALAIGQAYSGVVDGVRDFGAFIRLPNGASGLLHISQVELRGSTNPRRALFDMFPPGSEVEVVVREIKGDRISLTLPATLDKEAEQLDLKDLQDSSGSDLGSLGDVLDGLQL